MGMRYHTQTVFVEPPHKSPVWPVLALRPHHMVMAHGVREECVGAAVWLALAERSYHAAMVVVTSHRDAGGGALVAVGRCGVCDPLLYLAVLLR